MDQGKIDGRDKFQARNRIRKAAREFTGNTRVDRQTVKRGREKDVSFVAKIGPTARTSLADTIVQKRITRTMKRLGSMRRAQDRSPANKLARSLMKSRRSIDVKQSDAAHKPLNTSFVTRRTPELAAHIARKAATVMKAGEMMSRMERMKSRMSGPGGKKIGG